MMLKVSNPILLIVAVIKLVSSQEINKAVDITGVYPCSTDDSGTKQVQVNLELEPDDEYFADVFFMGNILFEIPEDENMLIQLSVYDLDSPDYNSPVSQTPLLNACETMTKLIGEELMRDFMSNCTSGDCLNRDPYNGPICPVQSGEYKVNHINKSRLEERLANSEVIKLDEFHRYYIKFQYFFQDESNIVGCFKLYLYLIPN